MSLGMLGLILLGLMVLGYFLGRGRATALAGGRKQSLHSRPPYHGLFVAVWSGLPALVLLFGWILLQNWIGDWFLLASLEVPAEGLSAEEITRKASQVLRLAAGTIGPAGLSDDVMGIQMAFCERHLLIEIAERRSAIAGDVASGVVTCRLIQLSLHHRQANEGLNAGQIDAAVGMGVFVVELDLQHR